MRVLSIDQAFERQRLGYPDAGELDRPALSKIIFNDGNARKRLNSATHLPVFVEMFRQLAVYWLKGSSLIVSASALTKK